MLIKKLYIHVGKESRERTFQIATTMIFCLIISFLVIFLSTFINGYLKNYSVHDDFYFTGEEYKYCPTNSNSLSSKSNSISMELIIKSPEKVWHSMSDEELMWRASFVPRIQHEPFFNHRTPKVAFMFLTGGRLPMAELWEMFFKGHEKLFSIYIHTPPDYSYEPPNSSVFFARRIPSKAVQWGKSTMVDAERRLLANALLDFSNERFILVSDSCIPLFNFTTIYTYLTHANLSFLNVFDDPRPNGRGRYIKRMWPNITISEWRKGSQWFEVNRDLAVEMISDVTLFNVFKTHCNPPCYMDEHYFPTLVNKLCPKLTSNRSITWTDWSQGGSHPKTFKRGDVSMDFLNRMRNDFNCSYNGVFTSVCHLFARKFHPNTLQPLLSIAPKLFIG